MRSHVLAVLYGASTALADAADWAAAYEKAETSLGALSVEEKVGIVSGIGWNAGGTCVGNTAAPESIDYPALCLQDGPLGVRYATKVNAFTPGIQAGSTWDRDLIRERGALIGEEMKGVGVHVMLGPAPGALGKIAQGGRNWEGFGADPYLQGIATAETVAGIQGSGVQATAKHYLLNEQELNRNTMSSDADDRSIHELYLWPFADAVHADVAAIMCSYNKANGTWACENPSLLDDLLKTELGFRGYVMTDWDAQHSTVESAEAGLDMTMPGSDFNGGNVYWGPQLLAALQNGTVAQARVDDMVTRILASYYLVGQDDPAYPPVNLDADVQGNHDEHVRTVARDGIVLLKNDNADDGAGAPLLPLDATSLSKIALVGSAAVAGRHANNECDDHACNEGALGMGWGSGTVPYPYFSSPAEAIETRAGDGTTIGLVASDDPTADQLSAALDGADVALVFLTADSGEGYLTVPGAADTGDRNNLDPWHGGNALVQAVAAQHERVVVVTHSVGPLILESVLEESAVRSVVWAGLPSQENGRALADVLFGDTCPSGKLPYTIARSEADYGTEVVNGDDDFSEGLFVDYRHFDQAGVEPRYEFGFGLSYTEFTYADISVSGAPTSGPATGNIIPGGRADLWETVATVTCTVSNAGAVEGAEVAQLYLEFPESAGTPPRQLRGFAKLPLGAGEAGEATFELRRRDLSVWDTAAREWTVPAGEFNVTVGASSRDLRLSVGLTVE